MYKKRKKEKADIKSKIGTARTWFLGFSDWLSISGSLASQRLGQFLEPFLQLQRKLLVALFTNGFHVKLHKFVPANKENAV